jgi:hypothetical protein
MTKPAKGGARPWVERVRRYLAGGTEGYRLAALDIENALQEEAGLTQKIVAKRLGRSETWISRLLKWHRAGCPEESIFEGEHSESRSRTGVASSQREKLDQLFVDGKLMRDGPWVQQGLPGIGGPRFDAPSITPSAHHETDASARFAESIGLCRRLNELLSGFSRGAMLAACEGSGAAAPAKLQAFQAQLQRTEQAVALAADETVAALRVLKRQSDFV